MKKDRKWHSLRWGYYFPKNQALKQKKRLEQEGYEVKLEPSEKTSIKLSAVGPITTKLTKRRPSEALWRGRFLVKYRMK